MRVDLETNVCNEEPVAKPAVLGQLMRHARHEAVVRLLSDDTAHPSNTTLVEWTAQKFDVHQRYLEEGGRFGRPQSAAKGCTDEIRCYG